MMKKIILGIIISSLIFSFNIVDDFDVVENSVVIKFADDFAPKLGKESPVDLKQLRSLSSIVNELTVLEFKTLFLKTEEFDQSEYKHSLHHYYILEFGQKLFFVWVPDTLCSSQCNML